MALALLAPGVTIDDNNTPVRIGGGGDPNIMMDGVSAMDTGSNRPLLQMNVESIAEVKVLTSGYQAEYGRASGVQVTASPRAAPTGSAGRSTTSSAIPTGTRTARPTSSTATPSRS